MSIRNDFFDKPPMQKQEELRKMSYEELRKIRYLDLSTRLLWHALHPKKQSILHAFTVVLEIL